MPCPQIPQNPTPTSHFQKGSIHWFLLQNPNKNISSLKARPFIIVSRTNPKSKRVLISPLQDASNYIQNKK